jgi:predicted AlkP superfamily pyrophosphatase or phosphodiesterase
VVVISIDGLRWDYLSSAAKIPTLRALAAKGAHGALKSIWPTVTYPAHTTLVTGVKPAKHGIVNNLPFDPLGQNFDGWYWYASEIKVPTLWDVAREKGWTTANVYWPVTVGAKFDWSFPQIWRARNDEDDKLMRALSTPGLSDEVAAKYGRIPGERRDDTARTEGAEYILANKHPELSFVYLTDLDTIQHGWGPHTPKAFETLEAIDKDVERVMTAAGPATIVIVSDHGFLPVTHVVKPNVLLRSAGLLDVTNGRVTGYRAAAWKAGGSCAIVLKDPAAMPIVKKMFDNVTGIARVHESVDGGFPGAALVLEAGDGFMFSPGVEGPVTEPTSERGAHGYSPDRKEMQATVIFHGPNIAPKDLGVVEMIDVAPTIARMMGIPFQADGKPLDL